MGLSNASKKARNYSQIITRNQGGGTSKAGLPYQVGRTRWTAIYIGCSNVQNRCCKLSQLQFTFNPNVHEVSRPIGGIVNNTYWNHKGLG